MTDDPTERTPAVRATPEPTPAERATADGATSDQAPTIPLTLTRRQARLFETLLVLATVGLGIVVIGMVGKIFFDFGDVILEFFLAWLIAFILSPIVRWLIDHVPRLPRVAAVVLVYLILFTGMVALIVFIAQTLANVDLRVHRLSPAAPRRPARDPAPLQSWLNQLGFGRSTSRPGHPGPPDDQGLAATIVGPLQSIAAASLGRNRDQPDRGDPVGLHPGRPGAHPGLPQPARSAGPARRRAAARDVGVALVRRVPAWPGGDRLRLRGGCPRHQRPPRTRLHRGDHGSLGLLDGNPVLRAVRVMGATRDRRRVRPTPRPSCPPWRS